MALVLKRLLREDKRMLLCVKQVEKLWQGFLGKAAAMANLRGIAVPILRDSWRQKCGMNNKEKLVMNIKKARKRAKIR